jgi:hypothetical protein
MLLRNVLERLELPCSHRTGTNVPYPALLDDIVQRLHDLLPWCASIQAVDLEDIDVRTQSLDALLHRIKDVLATQANLVHRFAVIDHGLGDWATEVRLVDTKVAFGEEDDFLTRDIELLDSLANDALGLAV